MLKKTITPGMLVRVDVKAWGELHAAVPSFNINDRTHGTGESVSIHELLLVIGCGRDGWLTVMTHDQGVVLVAQDFFKEAL
jgi:hypothetical protein